MDGPGPTGTRPAGRAATRRPRALVRRRANGRTVEKVEVRFFGEFEVLQGGRQGAGPRHQTAGPAGSAGPASWEAGRSRPSHRCPVGGRAIGEPGQCPPGTDRPAAAHPRGGRDPHDRSRLRPRRRSRGHRRRSLRTARGQGSAASGRGRRGAGVGDARPKRSGCGGASRWPSSPMPASPMPSGRIWTS